MYAARAWAQKVPDDFQVRGQAVAEVHPPQDVRTGHGRGGARRGRGLRRLLRGRRAAGRGGQAGRAAGPVPDELPARPAAARVSGGADPQAARRGLSAGRRAASPRVDGV